MPATLQRGPQLTQHLMVGAWWLVVPDTSHQPLLIVQELDVRAGLTCICRVPLHVGVCCPCKREMCDLASQALSSSSTNQQAQ